MADAFILQFTPIQQDYLRASRALLLKSPRIRVALVGMVLFELGLICAMVGNDFVRGPLPWMLTLVIPILLVGLSVGIPYRVSLNIRGNDRLLAPVIWELSDDA